MGRTIIKFAGQKEESEGKDTLVANSKSVTTEEEALRRVRYESAEIVDGTFLKKYFLEACSHLSPSDAGYCATMYSSLQGDTTGLHTSSLVYEDWKS
ncbi:hypothetical protein ABB37_08290 [Leptomonas pyrrhocoris]|uniref:Uncharacterized protein n=1 Tax=Leptomonas pyrrhocoris TaxID=157538 RepID=A0A0M9FTK6_LEPPY|nr:hypothetical protein ABB37_08290 [Leptomonas pyrrhocoris]XP_015654193.1 hypothetical protein ABB37_08290 [Leptomonas pyrrhocoris]KPA75753.1 hypothetical protein ABB37_08290 [Leptomonas pyrrhocoris]KPA75754.1 hypothetical protein ABB37_08290 [Leptomonas pyrrhocoris]|eukprot:XP_015654192.1 hypothetical protein ABB37_08290 [Leptomonas pyrrhocoris]